MTAREPSPFLTLPGAVATTGADSGVAAHYGNPVAEQRMLDAPRSGRPNALPTVVDLSGRGVISVTGPDRLSWLDSVTSQRLTGLAPGDSAETLLLSANGRIEHAIRVVDDGSTAWLLVDAAETTELEQWLQRMRFMLRVEIADRSDEFATIGWLASGRGVLDAVAPALEPALARVDGHPLVWADPWPEIVAGGVQYAAVDEHPGADWFWREGLVPRAALMQLADAALRGELAPAGVLAAEALRIAAWRPRLSTEVDEKSIPHELDWMRSAVHLAKGCYRGQETVAKVHNLGHPPRRLVQLQLDGSDSVLPAPGDGVFLATTEASDDAEPLGVVTSAGIHHEWGPIALAVLRRQTPQGVDLVVRTEAGDVAASAETIVAPDAGAAVGRVRLPRLGARSR
ncbi:CAF17-like 4Fe-4S cluster assembly/insertion protein YgfZ [Herbiconiux liangxiaofengii]|uniref:CAF17-like 4Fe-4S cluster assembly/insertion protein YgfZ n=1 Tax=Herbiconiux liangxiaofengii TaxID=3342795 RepID=UPI0035BAB2C2